MPQSSGFDERIAAAIGRLRVALDARDAATAPDPDIEGLHARIAQLEQDKAALEDELGLLRAKRDKDVAALDELIAQLKPLIEEV
jgi:hypothetical protein